ncbi:MAG TPA: hypothetical protein VIN35_02305, partial [Hydrogenophaga sp.]
MNPLCLLITPAQFGQILDILHAPPQQGKLRRGGSGFDHLVKSAKKNPIISSNFVKYRANEPKGFHQLAPRLPALNCLKDRGIPLNIEIFSDRRQFRHGLCKEARNRRVRPCPSTR